MFNATVGLHPTLNDDVARVSRNSSLFLCNIIVWSLNIEMARAGAIVDFTDHSTRGISSKYSFKITKIVEAKSIEVEYAGDFVGTGKWTFEPTDGKTKVQLRVNYRPKRLLFFLASLFVDNGKRHSDQIRKGFKALNSYLSKK